MVTTEAARVSGADGPLRPESSTTCCAASSVPSSASSSTGRAVSSKTVRSAVEVATVDLERSFVAGVIADISGQEHSYVKDVVVDISGQDAVEAHVESRLVRTGFWGNGLRRITVGRETPATMGAETGRGSQAPLTGFRRKRPQLELHQRSDVAPRGSAKEARIAEDGDAIGGMRHPLLSVVKVPGLRLAGALVRTTLEAFLDMRPDVIALIEASIATGACHVPEPSLEELASLLGKALSTDKLAKGPKSLWRAGLVQAFVRAAGDPDTALGEWLEHGAPTGVAKDIECLGIFPRTAPKGEQHRDIWKYWALTEPAANYASIHENEDIVKAEIRRLAAKGFVTIYPDWDAVLQRFGNVVVSKMAAVVKHREDGTVKLRIIIDMLRSRVNEHVRLHERIVLPRIQDLISDAVDFASFGDPEDELDMMVVDWEDAFHSMGVIPEELPHQVVKGFDGEYIGYETVLFGGAGSPGVWGRGAAFLGRSGTALFRPDEVRLQIYVDDPWSIWRGAPATRRRNRAVLLLWWLVLGPPLSWKKVQIGRNVRWIGVGVQLKGDYIHLTLDEGFLKDLASEIKVIMGFVWVGAGRLKKLVGKAEWAASIVPYLKAIIMPLWAATADAPGGRVGACRIRHALLWLQAFLRRTRGVLERVYHPGDRYASRNLIMELDASPWGYGGVLYLDGVAKYWFAEAVSKEDVVRFGIVVGEARFQALLEVLAVLIGLRTWAGVIGINRWAACVRSDSQAALGAAFRLRSPVPAINAVVREVALDLAESKYGIDFIEHLPGRCNVHADALSRFYQPGKSRDAPEELAGASRSWPVRRSPSWWETAGDPETRSDVIDLDRSNEIGGAEPLEQRAGPVAGSPGCSSAS